MRKETELWKQKGVADFWNFQGGQICQPVQPLGRMEGSRLGLAGKRSWDPVVMTAPGPSCGRGPHMRYT